jgi:hypothetical protein
MLKRNLCRVGLLAAVVVGAAACEKVPLLAPSASTISIAAQSRTLAPGGRTEVTATVVESGGTPVHNGTLVRFTASLGRVEPAEVETRGGVATTTFIAGDASGTAQIRASSGAASGGESATPTNMVEIQIGGAAATAVSVTASPTRVGPSGGTVTIIASALDASGNRLPGVPITFSTNAGNLSSSSAIADSAGEARVSLTTNREATVTARAGAQTATATVTVATAGTVTLGSITPASPLSGQTITLPVTPAAGTAPRVVVSWGDGTTSDLGVIAAASSATHVYQRAGSYSITATATADGETFTTSTSVSVGSGAGLTLDGPTPTNPTVGSAVSFTVKAAAGTTPRVVIDWGDGESTDLGTVSGDRSVVHAYDEAGTYIVTATATAAGDTFVTSKPVSVSARAPLSVSVGPSGARSSCSPVTFTASVTPSTVSIDSYRWSIASNVSSENDTVEQTSNQLSRTFAAGAKTVTVTATSSDGRTGTGQTNITCP